MIKYPKTVFAVLLAVCFLNFTTATGELSECADNLADTCDEMNSSIVTCGDTYYNSRSTSGYYVYPSVTLDLSCYSIGNTVTMYLYAHDVPNRFTIKKNGSTVVASGWLGCTTDAGPWGMSGFCNSASVNFNFTKQSGTYTLQVETSVNAVYDYWEGY